MIIPDVNLLLYAYNGSSQYHNQAKKWWETCLSGNEPVGLVNPVIFAFIRIATSFRVFSNPMSIPEVFSHINSWIARSVTQVLEPGSSYYSDVQDLLILAGSAGGNLVTDAQIAAFAHTHRAIVHTADYDFKRFPNIQSYYPLEKSQKN